MDAWKEGEYAEGHGNNACSHQTVNTNDNATARTRCKDRNRGKGVFSQVMMAIDPKGKTISVELLQTPIDVAGRKSPVK